MNDIFCDPFIKKVMADFVDNGGKTITLEEPIPIKKTLTHNELEKML